MKVVEPNNLGAISPDSVKKGLDEDEGAGLLTDVEDILRNYKILRKKIAKFLQI
jgi:hypothetical protein